MRLLFISHLYPNSVEPDNAPYNRQLIKAISTIAAVRVIAPVFHSIIPFIRPRGKLPPLQEKIDGISISHPRIFYVPGLFLEKRWKLYYKAVKPFFIDSVNDAKPDHVIAGFAYPDGVAVSELCREKGLKWSLRVNGSDVWIKMKQEHFCRIITDSIKSASYVFCPGVELKKELTKYGIEHSRIAVFQNGVDTELFKINDKKKAREKLSQTFSFVPPDIETKIFVCIGHHEYVKGQDRLLQAWEILESLLMDDENAVLVFIGEGTKTKQLKKVVERSHLRASVFFTGKILHENIPLWLNAADVLCLPSRSEGMPNVVMEAFACGIAVVATDVGEVKNIVREGVNGFIVPREDESFAEKFAEAMLKAARKNWNRGDIRMTVVGRTWDEAAQVLMSAIRSG